MQVNLDKLNALVLHLGNTPHVENLGKTKLWKLIYFIDVAFLREYGHSLTNSEYIKYDHGPVPSRGEKVLKSLSRDGLISIKLKDYGSYTQHHVTTTVEPEEVLSSNELLLINKICRKLGRATATHLSELSHLEPSWANAGKMQKISPELMHYGYEEVEEGL